MDAGAPLRVRGILCARSRVLVTYLSDILGLPLLDAIDVATHCARYKNEEPDPGDRAGKLVRARRNKHYLELPTDLTVLVQSYAI